MPVSISNGNFWDCKARECCNCSRTKRKPTGNLELLRSQSHKQVGGGEALASLPVQLGGPELASPLSVSNSQAELLNSHSYQPFSVDLSKLFG